MSIDNVKKFNNQDLIFSSGLALGAGALSSYVGAASVNYFPKGLPTDTFVNSVKNGIVGITDKSKVQEIKILEQYDNAIDNARNIKDLVKAEIDFKMQANTELSFDDLKAKINKKLVKNSDFIDLSKRDPDLAIDIYSGIKNAQNKDELVKVLTLKEKIFSEGIPFTKFKEYKRAVFYDRAFKNGYDIVNFKTSALDAIYEAYDIKKGKFAFDKDKLSKKIFNIVKNAADKIKYKRAFLYGISVAALTGGVTSFVMKILPKKVSKK